MNKTIEAKTIAQNIKNFRLTQKLTQIEMGETLGYSERQIRRLETEGTYSLDVLNLIASIFDVSVMDFLMKS